MIFKFEPIYQERVWGGQMLNTKLQRVIPPSAKIGESWDIVDRDDINSTMSKPFANVSSLRNLIQQEPKKIMGPQWMPDQKFPILVKWLDCSERLSLQVHPPELVAKKFSGEPKTENWYIGYASNDAGLFVGLKKRTTKEKFRSAVNNGTAEKYCHRIKSNRGDSILIESGRIHAIDAGNLILEIQQNSDTTYRVFDWDRNGLDGVPRKLHIEKSMECIDFNDFEPSILKTSGRSKMQNLADSKEFRIRKFNLVSDNEWAERREIVGWIANHLGLDAPVFDKLEREGTPNRKVSSQLIRKEVGWQPVYDSFKKAYQEMLAS